ncbi:hypothetical protein G6F52_013790 [Rhizopus delemar]|nr:hypothetical protein G6F52_013790 [Rhizopus delemar]
MWFSPGFASSRGLDLQCVRKRSAAYADHDNLFPSVLGLMQVKTSLACSPAPAEATATATAEATATACIPWDGGVGPVAGDAVNPPPGSGPAAGGCAFGRLRSSASQAKRPHPWGLDGAIHGANGPGQPCRPGPSSLPAAEG